MHRRRALIIGGSLGGLFAANLLRKIGWDVAVFERSPSDLADRGAGLGTRPELFAVMRRIGIVFEDTIGIGVRSRIGLARTGDKVCEVPIGTTVTAWDCIYRALRKVLPAECYHSGMELECFEQDESKIAARFADGSKYDGDLLVGADGSHSRVRRQLFPDLVPRYAGYVAWRGVAEERGSSTALDPIVFHHMIFCFPPGELALSNPMPVVDRRGDPCCRRCHFSWFQPVDYTAALPKMCTDADGHCHGSSIPPPLIRPSLIDAIRTQARAVLAPQVATMIERAERPILQPIFDLESPSIVCGRAVLLGDAAFVARPHVGTGVTKAALDAACLADVLLTAGDDIEAALVQYDARRRPFGEWLVARGRHIGRYLEGAGEQRGGAGIDPRPEIIMRAFGGAGEIDGHPNDRWNS
jgi:2-polyprenyl-6-methoxyphenol hydroxylase-like FAD-dependent oxidoreductase